MDLTSHMGFLPGTLIFWRTVEILSALVILVLTFQIVKNVNREFLALITDNVWLSYFLKKTPDLGADKTWIDFEIEISTAIIDLCNKASTASRKSTNARGINQHVENIKIQEHFGRFVCFENNRLTYKTLDLFKELQKFTNALDSVVTRLHKI